MPVMQWRRRDKARVKAADSSYLQWHGFGIYCVKCSN